MGCRLFLAGLHHFTVLTDHSYPLIPILNSHCLDEVENPRLQWLKTQLLEYNFTAEWRKSSQNYAPYALSHNPVLDPQLQDMLAEHNTYNQPWMSIREIRILTNDGCDNPHLQDLAGVLQMKKSTSDHSIQSPVDLQIIAANYQNI